MEGGDDAERDADDEGEEHGHHGEECRLRESGANNLAHAALALVAPPEVGCFEHHRGGTKAQQGGIGGILLGREVEIAGTVAVVVHRYGHKVVEVVEILQAYGLVAPEVSVDDVDALLVGALAEHHAGRVAGQDVEEEEDQSDYPQEHKEAVQKAF